MPVTISVMDHPATRWGKGRVDNSEVLLKECNPSSRNDCQRIIQDSFRRRDLLRESHISASRNGFVWAAYHAYCTHHHLVLRPEDIWFAILTQLSFYINAHAEDLRSLFVAHEGQKKLVVRDYNHVGSTTDYGRMAQEMTHRIQEHVVDPGLRDWILPSFSTTTDTDKVVGSILFMGVMQKYFTYCFMTLCGIPSVTLMGEIDDWKDILARLDKMDQIGAEPAHFATMLRAVVRMFVRSFEQPAAAEVVDFWDKIAYHHGASSGSDYLSGWITAFCFWDEKGQPRWYGHQGYLRDNRAAAAEKEFPYGVCFPTVDIDEVPSGFSSMPVTVDDSVNEFKATMVAGSVAIQASPEGVLDTLQPLSGWWLYKNVQD
ncbi:CFEM domain family protein [Apiospora saccharicola]|uniref:CFEM domain family protein n=1 Tax=Apiospora saccharicola TaxID=335842 RepID=A0ABR1TN18_9PEZI